MTAAPRGALLRAGVHVPRLRLPRACIADALAWTAPPRKAPSGRRAIGNWDEDALTLAVEAARGCRPRDLSSLQAVVLASTTSPFADRDPAAMLAGVLDLPATLSTRNAGGSLRAGTSALIAALHGPGSTLVVATDVRLTKPGSPQEQAYGDAAAAFVVGAAADDALADVLATVSLHSDFVDHYRMSGSEFDYALEERWVRDESMAKLLPQALADLLAQAGESAGRIAHLVLPAPAAAAERLARTLGLGHARRDATVAADCGDAGTAGPLLGLQAALEQAAAGELILVFGLGQGVDGLLLRAGGAAPPVLATALAQGREESSYVRYLSHRGLLDVDFGMRAERDQRTAHSVAYRKRAAVMSFQGGRCERCSTVQFPRSRVCVNPACRATDTQRPHALADSRGRVKTFTEDWQAFALRPPYLYGNVGFEEGGNLFMEFTDAQSGEIQVHDAVRFVFRIKDDDHVRQFRRYFWKAVRVAPTAEH